MKTGPVTSFSLELFDFSNHAVELIVNAFFRRWVLLLPKIFESAFVVGTIRQLLPEAAALAWRLKDTSQHTELTGSDTAGIFFNVGSG